MTPHPFQTRRAFGLTSLNRKRTHTTINPVVLSLFIFWFTVATLFWMAMQATGCKRTSDPIPVPSATTTPATTP